MKTTSTYLRSWMRSRSYGPNQPIAGLGKRVRGRSSSLPLDRRESDSECPTSDERSSLIVHEGRAKSPE